MKLSSKKIRSVCKDFAFFKKGCPRELLLQVNPSDAFLLEVVSKIASKTNEKFEW